MFHVEHFVADSEITRRTTHASCHTGQKPCSTGQTRTAAPNANVADFAGKSAHAI